MGGVISRCCNDSHESNEELRGRVVVLEEEIREMKRARERDAWAYEQRLADFASKEEEWKREIRKKQEEEWKREIRKKQEEEEEEEKKMLRKMSKEDRRRPCLEICEDDKERHFLVECMEEEQARREEAVAKWKQLYLTIKTELDDLIQRTREGERLRQFIPLRHLSSFVRFDSGSMCSEWLEEHHQVDVSTSDVSIYLGPSSEL